MKQKKKINSLRNHPFISEIIVDQRPISSVSVVLCEQGEERGKAMGCTASANRNVAIDTRARIYLYSAKLIPY